MYPFATASMDPMQMPAVVTENVQAQTLANVMWDMKEATVRFLFALVSNQPTLQFALTMVHVLLTIIAPVQMAGKAHNATYLFATV